MRKRLPGRVLGGPADRLRLAVAAGRAPGVPGLPAGQLSGEVAPDQRGDIWIGARISATVLLASQVACRHGSKTTLP